MVKKKVVPPGEKVCKSKSVATKTTTKKTVTKTNTAKTNTAKTISENTSQEPNSAASSQIPGSNKEQSLQPEQAGTTPAATKPDSIRIVGMGASAGGLEALEEFFGHMPIDSGMAFIVVVHQAATKNSLLPELLARCTKMKVAPIRDGMIVKPNRVYVVPPGKNVSLLAGTMCLTKLPIKHGHPWPVDYFFGSLAQQQGETAVAILLSGTGTDGTLGLADIKNGSGMAMVQSVESAKFDGMPQNAIKSGLADFVLSPSEMPASLVANSSRPFLQIPHATKQTHPILPFLPDIFLALRQRCGHDFSGYKNSTICRRIERRMLAHQIDEPRQYSKYLQQNESESEILFKELLIGVTSFFRDPPAFEALSKHALMSILKKKREDSEFRAWVPGCATGQEAYSLAILLRECMDELKIHLKVQIFGTDINNDAIEIARSGTFPADIAKHVSRQRLAEFFTKEENRYRIRKDQRDWLIFAPQNVIQDPPFTKLDLISCRNLLIYMNSDLQKKVVSLFHYSLLAGGYLFLGTSETISEFDDAFETVDQKNKIFRRSNGNTATTRETQFPVIGSLSYSARPPRKSKGTLEINVRELLTSMLADSFAPPTVVVNENGEIVHVHGRTGMFLKLAQGDPSRDIISMAREGLETDLSSALRKASLQDGPVFQENVRVRTNGNWTNVNLTVQKIVEPKAIRGMLRISFQVPPVSVSDGKKSGKKETTASVPQRIQELELELQKSRERVQRTVEELDASNEEMKSTNEELQSTNEEIETSKEELQSLNEELQTVNSELEDKIQDLSNSNDDLNNLLNATNIGTIFLDTNFCIKRFTEQATRVVHLIPTDVGRELSDLTSKLQYEQLLSDAKDVLETLNSCEREVQTLDGRWLLMRILPYRTEDKRIDGLVMTFVDIDDTTRAR
jgi:two-component system CheB/CheR fusion protein